MQSNQSDCSIHLHHHHLHLNARQNYVYVRMCSTAADPAHSRAEPLAGSAHRYGGKAATAMGHGGHPCVSSHVFCACFTFSVCRGTLHGASGLHNYSKTISSKLQHV